MMRIDEDGTVWDDSRRLSSVCGDGGREQITIGFINVTGGLTKWDMHDLLVKKWEEDHLPHAYAEEGWRVE